ncbi:MAG: hypothetical protein SGPRY_006372, partial [Prymnesium sp.]
MSDVHRLATAAVRAAVRSGGAISVEEAVGVELTNASYQDHPLASASEALQAQALRCSLQVEARELAWRREGGRGEGLGGEEGERRGREADDGEGAGREEVREVPPAAYDDDGLRERSDVLQSELRRKAREKEMRERTVKRQDEVREAFGSGRMGMEEFARLAREAGLSAREVAAALKERREEQRVAGHNAAVAAATAREVEEAREGGEGGEAEMVGAAKLAKGLGLDLLQRGEFKRAGEAFADAASLAENAQASTPSEGEGEGGVGQAEGKPGEEAIERLRESSLLNEALCWLKAEEWEAAATACGAVLARRGDQPKARFRRAQARRKLGRLEEAKDDLVVACALVPSDKEVRRAYGEVIEQIKAARAKAVESELTASRMKEMAQSETAGGGEGRISQSLSPQVNVEARSYCFMRFSVDGEAVGSVLLQLFDDLLPTTAANFLAFCRGEVAINGRSYGYAGCPLHRIVRGFVLQGGDVISGDGGGCVSAVGEGGTVLHGLPVLRRLEALPTDDAERPFQSVLISECGELTAEE